MPVHLWDKIHPSIYVFGLHCLNQMFCSLLSYMKGESCIFITMTSNIYPSNPKNMWKKPINFAVLLLLW